MRYSIAIVFGLLSLIVDSSLSAQSPMVMPSFGGKKVVNKGSELHTSPLVATVLPSSIEQNFDVSYINLGAIDHSSVVSASSLAKLKAEAVFRPQIGGENSRMDSIEGPKLQANFKANTPSGSVPMDNSFAISKNGFIVSAINTNVVFTNPKGVITYEKALPDFFLLLGLGTRMYDPRVIYDVENDRFILICLYESTPAGTHLCIGFSQTEDPNGLWNYYKIDGNPNNDNFWFDYPNVAVSAQDLYISGLMRTTAGDWNYTVVYQIDKYEGFAGQPITWKHYYELFDADGAKSFNLVPTPAGWNHYLSPGMYFVSNNAQGGNTYNFYYTTNSVKNNPELVSQQTTGFATQLAPNARQKGTNNVLNTFDSRIWSALYLNGTIHFGGHVLSPYNSVGLLYGRFDVLSGNVDATILADSLHDYAFPSFSAFGDKETDQEVLVNYLYSGPNDFPGIAARSVLGNGNVFNWSKQTILKTGNNYINALQDEFERWGDYTTSCRRFNGKNTEAWVVGSYGLSLGYGNWLGQYNRPDDLTFVGDFVANKTTFPSNTSITYSVVSADVTSVVWQFEGGNPATSVDLSPIIKYEEDGTYTTSAIITHSSGAIDTVLKEDYIHVQPPLLAPIADFYAEEDTIYTNDTAYFHDNSLNDAKVFSWAFPGGTPIQSSLKDPEIVYKNVGQYDVIYTARNLIGSDAETKKKYITVLKREVPQALFSPAQMTVNAGKSITFVNQSKNGPTDYLWTFEGGSPLTSSEKNPTALYATPGNYGVTLIASNSLGADTLRLINAITVLDPNGTADVAALGMQLTVFPNPSAERATVQYYQEKAGPTKLVLYRMDGAYVTTLWDAKTKKGLNELSFNVDQLPTGSYLVYCQVDQQVNAVRLMVIR